MTNDGPTHDAHASRSIWGFAFGYFAAYVPYAALTKVLSDGSIPGQSAIPGAELLPATAVASALAALAVITALGWWRHAHHVTLGGVHLPCPARWTLLSGIASAAVIVTTTLAYTFRGVSIVFMVLLMKGGVLVIAPIVDAASHRAVRWFSWTGLGLSLAALAVTFRGDDLTLSPAAGLDVAVYLGAYFVRLQLMSKLGKRPEHEVRLRYFVEEHMVASPALLAILAVLALADLPHLRDGFARLLHPQLAGWGLLVGLLSEGTGVFGALVLLDPRESSFAVPVNRASSILAGVVGSLALAGLLGFAMPASSELVGAGLVVLAIGVLAAPGLLGPRARATSADAAPRAG
ncbi:MAG: hypothetical protein JST54_27850 [Deltaproteobacteria bacterium]|nr:hypothetical protein [Deltaproteobacteria bacterium]